MDELFEAWLRRQSDALRADTLWKMESYRHALYLVDLAKADVGLATAAEHASLRGQLLTAVISISANIAEGYSRPTLADRARFFSYALGSARESFSWYLGLQGIIGDHVAPGANIMTDDHSSFAGLEGRYHHHTVNHSAGEYVRHFFAHTNGIESVWALLKRQIYGIHHFVSVKHLHRYVAEATWRFNRRGVEDRSRVAEFLGRVDGRLTYNTLIGKA